MNINLKVIGLTQRGIKPKSIVPDADALIIWPSKLLTTLKNTIQLRKMVASSNERAQ